MLERYQKVIDAIVEKARRDCPGSLALIGVYGSCCTGDVHEKSDLDLLILINDEKGYCLSKTFLEEEACIGHDLYCTTWQMLQSDAKFRHPHISKLMDSKILYCASDEGLARLESLRKQVMDSDTQNAAVTTLDNARKTYAQAMTAENLAQARYHSGVMMHQLFAAVALLNNRYFRLGVRRVFDELEAMPLKPENLKDIVEEILSASSLRELQAGLTRLLRSVETLFPATSAQAQPFPGTYEEMFSNWRNKMVLAAETGDRFLSFDSLFSLNGMLTELGYRWDILGRFDPHDLSANAKVFDETLELFLKEYEKAGISPAIYPTLDDFIRDYLK